MSRQPFKPWPLRWTPEHKRRFWDWYAQHDTLQSEYFSKSVGHSMLAAIERHVSIEGTVIDMGAGTGFVTELLLARGVTCLAVDSSPASVEALQHRFGAHPQFLGAAVSAERVPLGDQMADAVFLIETIEHTDPPEGLSLLREALRVVRSGGYVVITTPHKEPLSRNEVMCPECGCVFHRMQHLRSFSAGELAAFAAEAGLRTVVSRPTFFSAHRGLHARLEGLRRLIGHYEQPHLLYIGQRP